MNIVFSSANNMELEHVTGGSSDNGNVVTLSEDNTGEASNLDGTTAPDITGTVAKHYNELQEAGKESRTFSRIYHLRNFNNWTKSILIGDTLEKLRNKNRSKPLVVLDLCSGKGGDLLKWKKGRIDRLICADIATTSVEQSESRYKEMVERTKNERHSPRLFEAEFIVADCTKEILKEHYKDSTTQFDLVSCQFSFHYSFESYQQAELMLQNACECLRPGGYFIGTTPNSNELIKRLRTSSDHSFGNDVYKVTFPESDKSNFPLYGAKYDFHLEGVVDCPEFLVFFPLLEKMSEKYGMKLVEKKPFADYFSEKIERGDTRSLISRMNALEAYPTEEELVGNGDDDYTHAKEFLSTLKSQDDRGHGSRRPVKIGTLSKAEWEAITIYLVFVFQKMGGDETDSETGETSHRRKHETDILNEPSEKRLKSLP